jgi:hypothetical protein
MSRIHSGNDLREAGQLAKRAMRPVRHLSYFERIDAQALGKTLDAYGNLDLNDGANQITQPAGLRRINPNVKTSATYSDNSDAPQDSGESTGVQEAFDETTKVQKVHETYIRSFCARNCQKNGRNVQGRSSCEYCLGEGWIAKTERIGKPTRNDHYAKTERRNANQPKG